MSPPPPPPGLRWFAPHVKATDSDVTPTSSHASSQSQSAEGGEEERETLDGGRPAAETSDEVDAAQAPPTAVCFVCSLLWGRGLLP